MPRTLCGWFLQRSLSAIDRMFKSKNWLTNLLRSFSLCVPGPRPGRGHVSVTRALFPWQPWQEHHAERWSANSAAHGQLQPRGGGVQSALASQPPAWGSIPLSANTRPAQCRIIFLFPRETGFFVGFFLPSISLWGIYSEEHASVH